MSVEQIKKQFNNLWDSFAVDNSALMKLEIADPDTVELMKESAQVFYLYGRRDQMGVVIGENNEVLAAMDAKAAELTS